MIRTQVQLTDTQSTALKTLASTDNVSMAELIRRSVDLFLAQRTQSNPEELKQQAMSVLGKYSSMVDDVSTNHDVYLADAFAANGD